MKILVCGGRNYADRNKLYQVLAFMQPTCIVTGMARGADTLAYDFAKLHGIPTEEHPAQWDKYGKSAGFRRNEEMLRSPNLRLVLAFPGGNGTAHMARIATAAGILVKHIG